MWLVVIVRLTNGYLYGLSFCSLREIAQKSSEELAREGSGVKAFSSFLSELSSLVPELIISNISVLITHLEGEVRPPDLCCTCLCHLVPSVSEVRPAFRETGCKVSVSADQFVNVLTWTTA